MAEMENESAQEEARERAATAAARALLAKVQAREAAFRSGWWTQAEETLRMYEKPSGADESKAYPFNILYANTEILLPALYGATPRPDVVQRWDKPSTAAQAVERLLTVLVDDNTPGSESFDCAVGGAVLSALVPGLGGVRIRHFPGDFLPVRWEEYKYDQLIWADAKKWSKVPWIAFRHHMSTAEVLKQFPEVEPEELKIEPEDTADPPATPARTWVYEVWNKATRTVQWLSEDYKEVVLSEVSDDPLKLAGFYPTPGLLTLVRKPNDLNPVPLFAYYRNQAEELNRVTVRLNYILAALKVRGAYNATFGTTFENILKPGEAENTFVPTNLPLGTDSPGLDRQIWIMPLEKLVLVAQQLYTARQQILQVIYQLTGLADIVRGSTVASETATAQELKNKWGSIRLRRMQRAVQTYIRDLLRLATDAASAVATPQQWAQVTQMDLPFAAQKMQATQQYQLAALAAESTGQPPPPPPPVLQTPAWEELLATLNSDAARALVIDIETDSSLEDDATSDRKDVTEFMGALQGLAQGLQPLAALGPEGLKAIKVITLAVLRKFKMGREVESALKALPDAPPPPQPDPADKLKLEEAQLKLQGEREKQQAESASIRQQAMLAERQHTLDMATLERKSAADMQKHQLEMQKLAMQQRSMAMQAMTPPKPKAGRAPS